jgi:ankyrin repeat protein
MLDTQNTTGTRKKASIVVALVLTAASVEAAGDLRLVEAVRNRNREAVRTLLQQRVDVNVRQADGATALHWAAYRDDLETAGLLIRAGADVNVTNELGIAPLYLACENGNAVMVETLLRSGANPAAALPSGETALMTAARSGSAGAVTALIAHGADVHAREKVDGQTALMWAVSQQHPEVVQALINAGASVKARSDVRRQVVTHGGARGAEEDIAVMEEGGFTPLLFASRVGDVSSARLLLVAGADVNDATPDGASALVVAAHSGHTALTSFLLEKGADPNAARAGYTALHVAVLRGDPEMVKAILARGANPNVSLARGTVIGRQAKLFMIDGALVGATPFFLAAKYADVRSMRLLAAAGADPLRGLKDGSTPLMVAAGMLTTGFSRGGGDRQDREMDTAEAEVAFSQDEDLRVILNSGIEAVKLAVALGADVNAVNQAGDTALHSAAHHGFESVIAFLVARGARLDAKNKAGLTPLMEAESRRNADDKTIATVTAALLRRLGANQ